MKIKDLFDHILEKQQSAGNIDLNKEVSAAKAATIQILKQNNIDDTFIVRVKDFGKNINTSDNPTHWIALKRGGTLDNIFWINKDILSIMDKMNVPTNRLQEVLIDSLLHEYGHVVWQDSKRRSDGSWSNNHNTSAVYETIYEMFYGDEEDFSEAVARHLSGKEKDIDIANILKMWVETF